MGETTEATVTVMLVDHHAVWRAGLCSMLQDTEFEVVGETGSGQEALDVARQVQPQFALLDIRLEGADDGLDVLVALKQEFPNMAIVILTDYDEPTYMARAVAGGATGYLLKRAAREELMKALRDIVQDLLYNQELLRILREGSETSIDAGDLIEPLTDREEEVLRLLATGLSNRDIATILFVTESAIKTDVEHILNKLEVSDRVQAAVWAARHGLGPDLE